MIDAQQVKVRISLRELFERDGHSLRRAGSAWICRSPFSQEKTPSCYVHEEERFFKCFSSGAGGDCFVYWQATRGVGFTEAVAALAQIAGLSEGYVPALLPAKPMPEPLPELAPRLDGAQLEKWLKAVERLRGDPAQQKEIAEWRGYAPETIAWAVERGLIGWLPYQHGWREAFVVERPEGEGLMPVGYHVRLAPSTPGNDGQKSSWRFVPPRGVGAWPFVVGNVRTARVIFCTEGQWDALALVDAMGWAEEFPDDLAVVGMRGASSWKRFVKFYHWPNETTFFMISDSDPAGQGWFAPDGFADAVRPTCKRLWGFWPESEQGKDFNDWWRARVDGCEALLHTFKRRMAKPAPPAPPKITFLAYCNREHTRPDELGKAAEAVRIGPHRPRGRRPFSEWVRWWTYHLPPNLHAAAQALWDEWAALKPNAKPVS